MDYCSGLEGLADGETLTDEDGDPDGLCVVEGEAETLPLGDDEGLRNDSAGTARVLATHSSGVAFPVSENTGGSSVCAAL